MNEFKSGCHPIVSDAFLANYITGAGGYATLNNHIIKSLQDQVKRYQNLTTRLCHFTSLDYSRS